MLPESAGGGVESLVFYLDRGNGQVTRLIPADILPPLGKVPAREAYHPGMVVLGSPGGEMAQGIAGLNERACIKGNPDRQVTRAVAASTVNGGSSSRSSSGRRHKVYCDKWIHEGVCAFTQQGCRFKHEMPFDEATQRLLGLFQGLPGWYRKSQDERADRMPVSDGPTDGRASGLAGVGERGDAMASRPLEAYGKIHRPHDDGGPLVPYHWGPVGAPAGKQLAGPGVYMDTLKRHRMNYRGVSTQSVTEFCSYGTH